MSLRVLMSCSVVGIAVSVAPLNANAGSEDGPLAVTGIVSVASAVVDIPLLGYDIYKAFGDTKPGRGYGIAESGLAGGLLVAGVGTMLWSADAGATPAGISPYLYWLPFVAINTGLVLHGIWCLASDAEPTTIAVAPALLPSKAGVVPGMGLSLRLP